MNIFEEATKLGNERYNRDKLLWITDRDIEVSLKRFKPHVVVYALLVRLGILGFFITALNGGRIAMIGGILSYILLGLAVVWGAINIVQSIFFRSVSTSSTPSAEVLVGE